MCMHAKPLQWCPTICNPMDCSLPGSTVHGILQARILEWVAIPDNYNCTKCPFSFFNGDHVKQNWLELLCYRHRPITVFHTSSTIALPQIWKKFDKSFLKFDNNPKSSCGTTSNERWSWKKLFYSINNLNQISNSWSKGKSEFLSILSRENITQSFS